MNKKGNIGAIIALVAIGLLFVGVLIWRIVDKANTQAAISSYDANSIIAGNAENGNIADHVKGDAEKAKVIIYEYADFQCPGCGSANPRINKLIEEYNGDLAIVYRNYLLSYHQNGTAAASAAEAAGLQGYWKEYADKLFANQSLWEDATGENRTQIFVDMFRTVTGGAGDEAKFKKDMTSEAVKKKINFDAGIAEQVEITGTPAFFLDGERIDFTGTKGEEGFLNVFREKIDEKLGK